MMYKEYEDALTILGVADLVKVMHNFGHHKQQATIQHNLLASHAPKIDKSFCEISFQKMTRKNIYDIYRATSHLVIVIMHSLDNL